MNLLAFTGNLGQDCRKGTGGNAVVNFSVAMKSGFGDKATTIWVDCALWGKQAESKLPEYLVKGQQVAISGEMGIREHDGKTYITCRVSSVDLIGKAGESSSPAPQQQAPARAAPAPAAASNSLDDDIPF
jgi:single-strand DNA-binding protein